MYIVHYLRHKQLLFVYTKNCSFLVLPSGTAPGPLVSLVSPGLLFELSQLISVVPASPALILLVLVAMSVPRSGSWPGSVPLVTLPVSVPGPRARLSSISGPGARPPPVPRPFTITTSPRSWFWSGPWSGSWNASLFFLLLITCSLEIVSLVQIN